MRAPNGNYSNFGHSALNEACGWQSREHGGGAILRRSAYNEALYGGLQLYVLLWCHLEV